MCRNIKENALHLFVECPFMIAVWDRIKSTINILERGLAPLWQNVSKIGRLIINPILLCRNSYSGIYGWKGIMLFSKIKIPLFRRWLSKL